MMDKLRTAPLPLRRKLLLTALAGAAFFLVGLAAILFSLDTVTALLSGILAIGLAFKTAELYRLIITGHYTDIDGICIAITQTPLRKYRNIRIIDSQERERTLVLPRQDKIEVGRRYRFYFNYFKSSAHKSPAQVQTGSSFIDEALPTDGFLGLEAASDYSNIDTVR